MPRARTHTLACPVRVPPDDDPCGRDLTVEAYPGHPGSFHEPPEGPEIHVLAAPYCDHFALLQEERDEHMDALLAQLAAFDR